MSFRAKLLQAILSIVVITTAASLFIAQRQNSASFQQVVDDLFRQRLNAFQQEQDTRLAVAAQEAGQLANSVRLFAALEEDDAEVYKIAADELRMGEVAFFRLLNARGQMISPPRDGRAGLVGTQAMHGKMIPSKLGQGQGAANVQIGFLQIGEGEDAGLFRILASPISNFEATVGTLILGQRMNKLTPEGTGRQPVHGLLSGLWMNERLIGAGFPPEVDRALLSTLRATQSLASQGGQFQVEGGTYRFERYLLNQESSYPPAFLVSIFSLAEFQSQQRTLALRIVLTGVAALVLAGLLGSRLSRQLAQPVADLVSATQKVRTGNYEVKLPPSSTREMNTLAESFNEMTAGLALKDRYHSVLQQVTDPQVAEELIAGRVRLGGELREVSVIFCDIRGYTAMTVGRDPAEVIEILNHHMGALTRIVQAHRGVINQFAGDAIMTLFGAPKSYGDDAQRAVRCACAMMRERERMNVKAAEPLRIGIGIATGKMVAGCIGAESRSDYTVVGERVNLAARLCSSAQAGQILMDEETRVKIGSAFSCEPLQPLVLKGFSQPVPAFRVMCAQDSPL